jgi:putative addiction module component (TIGR02574 family)
MTAKTLELVAMVESLPVDIKTLLVEKILDSLGPTDKEIDELWKVEVERRIDEVESGKVKTIPGDEVFAKVHDRFAKSITRSITKLRSNFSRQLSITKTAAKGSD